MNMSKSFSYPNKGTCSKETHIVLNDDHTSSALWRSCKKRSSRRNIAVQDRRELPDSTPGDF